MFKGVQQQYNKVEMEGANTIQLTIGSALLDVLMCFIQHTTCTVIIRLQF